MNPSKVIVFLIIILFSATGSGQEIKSFPLIESLMSEPEIIHYTRNEYKSDSEFWSGCIDQNDIIYFGNNDGILIYNGEKWQSLRLPNSSSVRTLICTSDNTVYAGGYNEVGVVKKNEDGTYYYKSLIDDYHLEGRLMENLEQAHELNNTLIFRFYNELLVVKENQIVHLPSVHDFMYSNVVNGKYYTHDMLVGLLAFDPVKNNLRTVIPQEEFPGEVIKGLFPTEEEDILFLFTESGKIYKADLNKRKLTPWENLFKDGKPDQLISIVKKDDRFYAGTLDSKLKLLDENGKLMESPASFSDIQNKTILDILPDETGMWLLLNNGLDYLNTSVITHKFFKNSRVYDIKTYKNKLYIASNRGLYYADLTKKFLELKEIEAAQGIVWTLNEFNGDLLAGHIKGLMQIKDDKVIPISNLGTWKITRIPGRTDRFLACGFNGLHLIAAENGGYRFIRKIEGFEESTRDIIASDDPDTYWICHGFKGVYRIKINENYDHVYAIEHYTDENGLESQYNVNVYRWNDQVVFTTNYGIYTFNDKDDRFEPFQPLNEILDPTKNTRKILEEKDKTWFVEDDVVGFFYNDSIQKGLHEDIFLRAKGILNRGMESILPLNDKQVLVGSTDGVFLFQTSQPKKLNSETYITRAEVNGDKKKDLLQISTEAEPTTLPDKTDHIHFEFATPKLATISDLKYQYRLIGISDEWSEWQENNYREFNHLKPGEYEFQVRSKDQTGNLSKTGSYGFIILPEWYETPLSRLLFLMAFALMLYLSYMFVKRKLERENIKAQEKTLKEKKLLELEVERLRLQRDKEQIEKAKSDLEYDMIQKSKELANFTMQLVNKKDIFNEIQSDLKELRNVVRTKISREKVTEIFRKLHQHKIGEEYMEVFDVNFETVHHEFFEKLNENHPNLSKRDQRLCAFIIMDLTNKEIAPLLNLSVRGVETLRYRVRKKLELDHDDKLYDYLKNLS
ncbi:helix-turn-helix and ligand-binding sensor domain-containing protein [Robertkochia solimangrovi]|uniref:helix-turn-helix and ligand-binding sensor domain-containing protein n=1 Tax=Robertkochia solimangrovi TaxID=2213046 RepID=UPI00117DA8E1|nr:triple tyrosine motif-containing protein [Robertkochia solimangrovi]TRZ44471.1 hypothetical protein DMZ48_08185 [Robertkochia solimangrovi]